MAARAKSTYVADTSSSGFDMDMNHATRLPLTGGGRVAVVVRGTKGSILAQACSCLFFIVRTFTRLSLAQRVAFVVMLCQLSVEELMAAALVISGRSHHGGRMAARRRQMAALRAFARPGCPNCKLVLAFRVLRCFLDDASAGEILLGL